VRTLENQQVDGTSSTVNRGGTGSVAVPAAGALSAAGAERVVGRSLRRRRAMPGARRPSRDVFRIGYALSVAGGSGELVRRAREAAGLTQRQLALRAGTKQAAISQVERGEVEPSLARLRSLIVLTGHELDVTVRPRRMRIDEGLFLDNLRLLPEERLELTVELSRHALATQGAAERAWLEQVKAERALFRQ
jgi:transcriptional regulator with XRE-family HTH domain